MALRAGRRGDMARAQGKAPSKTEAAVPVRVVSASQADLQYTLEVTGTIYAQREITLSSKVSGKVVAVGSDEGNWVQAGQTLVRLEDTQARAVETGFGLGRPGASAPGPGPNRGPDHCNPDRYLGPASPGGPELRPGPTDQGSGRTWDYRNQDQYRYGTGHPGGESSAGTIGAGQGNGATRPGRRGC